MFKVATLRSAQSYLSVPDLRQILLRGLSGVYSRLHSAVEFRQLASRLISHDRAVLVSDDYRDPFCPYHARYRVVNLKRDEKDSRSEDYRIYARPTSRLGLSHKLLSKTLDESCAFFPAASFDHNRYRHDHLSKSNIDLIQDSVKAQGHLYQLLSKIGQEISRYTQACGASYQALLPLGVTSTANGFSVREIVPQIASDHKSATPSRLNRPNAKALTGREVKGKQINRLGVQHAT